VEHAAGVSTLGSLWALHGPADDPNSLRYLELSIDGAPLKELFARDCVTPFGWGTIPSQMAALDALLMLVPGELPGGRVSLHVCHVCGDAGCGAVAALVEQRSGLVVWRDFGVDDPNFGQVDRRGFEDLGPFYFEANAYRRALEEVRRVVRTGR